jgi:uncharacterized Zn finger protein
MINQQCPTCFDDLEIVYPGGDEVKRWCHRCGTLTIQTGQGHQTVVVPTLLTDPLVNQIFRKPIKV